MRKHLGGVVGPPAKIPVNDPEMFEERRELRRWVVPAQREVLLGMRKIEHAAMRAGLFGRHNDLCGFLQACGHGSGLDSAS